MKNNILDYRKEDLVLKQGSVIIEVKAKKSVIIKPDSVNDEDYEIDTATIYAVANDVTEFKVGDNVLSFDNTFAKPMYGDRDKGVLYYSVYPNNIALVVRKDTETIKK